MNIQFPQSMRLPVLVGGIVALVFGGAALAYTLIPVPPRAAPVNSVQTNPRDVSGVRAGAEAASCKECGVIESVQRAAPAGNAPAMYKITVRLGDSSTYVVNDPSPAAWRPGERMILIAGRDQVEAPKPAGELPGK